MAGTASAPSSRWRDAATVVAWVTAPGGRVRVLMIERPATQPGWPGQWVFPGGGVGDADRRWAERHPGAGLSTLQPAPINQSDFMHWARPWFLRHLGYMPEDAWPAWDRDPLANRAAEATAARELWEEAGLWLGPAVDVPAVPRTERTAGDLGLPVEHLSVLRYWGRLATPPHEPRRFDCRFFGLDCSRAPWPAARGAPAEVKRLAWRDPEDVLHGDDSPLPTRYVLEHLRALIAGPRTDDPDKE
ncbi:MAG: hypothetical protein M0Z54_15085 [Thermaerobacter sp.]|nr:hypothetical protein [Thermaerobacter sp.]